MQGFTRVLIVTLMSLWAIACSSSEEVPKAKSTSAGDALKAGGESGGTTSTTTTEQNSGSDSKKEEEEEEEEEEDDGNADGDDEDDGKGSALTFKSSSRDDNDYSLAVKVGSKGWERKEWPKEGEAIEFAGLCKGSKVTIQVKVIHEEGKEITQGTQLKVEASGKTAKISFEEGQEEGDGDIDGSPDDLVGELSCSKTKISIK